MKGIHAAAVCWLSSLGVFLTPGLAASAEPNVKHVLVLHYYGQETLLRASFDPAIVDALRAESSGPIDLYVETLESYRFPDAVGSGLVRDFLKAKYADRKIDVVIAVADPALNFARRNRDVFGNAPIVALVIRADLKPGDDEATGLQQELGIRGTLDVALKLEPETKRVVVVDGVLDNSGAIETEFTDQIKTFEPALEVQYLRDLPLADLVARIKATPDKSIVFFIRQGMLDRSTSLPALEGLAQVVRASPVPVFTATAEQIGLGPVGGDVWQVRADATRLADMALRIANGASPREIPPSRATMMSTLDWRQLRRWHIPETRAPSGSLMLFREPSFMELYGQYITGGVLIVGAQLALIVNLLIQRVGRRRAEERSRAMLQAVPDLMFVLQRDGTYLDYHARDPKLLFLSPSLFMGKKVREIMPPDLAEMFMDGIGRAFHNHHPIVVEYKLQVDEERHFEARIVRAGADRVLSMVRDVTESKRATELIRDLAGRLITSQELERERIARELHDEVSQKIAVLTIGIDQVAAQMAADAPRSQLRQLAAQAEELAEDVHNLSYALHPSRLQTLGLESTLESLCRDISRQTGVKIVFAHSDLPHAIDPNVSLCLYRIVQEALQNISRHSQTREAQVRLAHQNGDLTVRVSDSGVGFDPLETRNGGLGLISMHERTAFLGGQLTIHAAPGSGTRIDVRIPLIQKDLSAAPTH